jgi:chondroitin AC lyase
MFISGRDNNTDYVWHDSIAYFFPGAQELKTSTLFRRANWKEIDGASFKVEEDSLVSIFLGHNNSDTYAYIIKPGMGIEQTKEMNARLPVRILSNTKSLQAIQSGNTVQAVFFEPGVLHISENNDLSAEQACILIYRSNSKEIWVADPTRKLSDITLSINGKKINLALPKGDYAGSTIMIVAQ